MPCARWPARGKYRLRRSHLPGFLAKPFVTSVIIGAKSMDQLRDNVASTRVRLDDAEMKQLDEISALQPEYPEWMIAYQGQARLKVPVKV